MGKEWTPTEKGQAIWQAAMVRDWKLFLCSCHLLKASAELPGSACWHHVGMHCDLNAPQGFSSQFDDQIQIPTSRVCQHLLDCQLSSRTTAKSSSQGFRQQSSAQYRLAFPTSPSKSILLERWPASLSGRHQHPLADPRQSLSP